ncbi:MAG: sulfatase [Planctomycetota bacterium]
MPAQPPNARRGLALGLTASLIAVVLLVVLEARGLAAAGEGAGAAVVVVAFDLLLLAPVAAAVLLLAASLLRAGDRALHPRRLALALAAALAVWPLGRSLGEGAGLARQGLAWAPGALLPVLAAIFAIFAARVATRRFSVRPRLGSGLLLLAALAVRVANARLFVGLYAVAHDALFFLEFGLWAATAFLLLGGTRRQGAGIGLVATAVLVLAASEPVRRVWPLPFALSESTRSALGREGFHGARLLRWRGARGDFSTGLVSRDDRIVGEIEAWQARAAEAPGVDLGGPVNFVWISIDTLRADRCGFLPGSVRREGKSLTPNLDALAARSAVFERAWAPYPSTHLSFEAATTGRYPRATALYRELTGTALASDVAAPSMAALLRASGRRTIASIAFTEEWMSHPSFARKLGDFEAVNLGRQGAPDLDARHFVASAERMLDEVGEAPFHLWFHAFEPHAPYLAHEEFPFGDAPADRYDAEVAYVDRRVGDLLAALERRGLAGRTVIAVSSDHGEALGEGGIRYHGSALTEVQLHVPLMIHVPGVSPTRRPELVSLVDLFPTVMKLLGVAEVPPNQGRDLTPLVFGDEARSTHFPEFQLAELPDDVKELSAASSDLAALRRGDLKLTRHLAQGYSTLVDLAADPGERRDFSATEPAAKARLEAELAALIAWDLRFGRREDPERERARRREEIAVALGDADVFRRLGAVRAARELDLRGLAASIAERARDPREAPELRREAARALATWNAEDAEAVLVELAGSEAPILRWSATVDAWRLDPLPVLPLAEEDEETIRTERRLLALARAEAPAEAAAEARFLVEGPGVDPALRRRALQALALGGAEAPRAEVLAGEPWSVEEGRRLFAALRRHRPDAAWDFAERLARDRYLRPELREAILDAVPSMPDDAAAAVGRHLLAGWDPAFDRSAREVLGARFGEATVARMASARQAESEAEAVAQAERWEELPAEFARVLEILPADLSDPVLRLRQIRALLAAGRFAEAEKVRLTWDTMPLAPWSARRVARSRSVLAAARLAEGALPEDARIRVTRVKPEPAAATRILPGRAFSADVWIENRADRALPGGRGPMAGRLRVLWTREGEAAVVYGREHRLEAGLLPGESGSLRFAMEAPDRPGRYRGRVIASQNTGARFHVHEVPTDCEFAIEVLDPSSLPAPASWTGAEIARNLPPPRGVELWHVDSSGRLRVAMTGFGVTFTLGAFPWREDFGVRWTGSLAVTAGTPPALSAELLDLAGASLARGEVALGAAPASVAELALPAAAPGAVLRLVPGGRAGLLTLTRLELGAR